MRKVELEKSVAKNNPIVKYKNDFNLTYEFNALKAAEQDIAFTIMAQFSTKKVRNITLSAAKIKKAAMLTDKKYTESKFIPMLQHVADSLSSIKFHYTDVKEKEVWGVLFTTFLYDREADNGNGLVTVITNPAISGYLYDIPGGNFSNFELDAFLPLQSRYSKILFRQFLQHFHGFWDVSTKDFIDIMQISTKKSFYNFVHRKDIYIKDIESTGYFNDVNLDIVQAKGRGNPIIGLRFTYKLNKDRLLAARTNLVDPNLSSFEGTPVIDHVKVSDGIQYVVQDNVITGREKVHTEERQRKCPKGCGGYVVERLDSKGRRYLTCTNSKYLPKNLKKNTTCDYYESLDNSNEFNSSATPFPE